MSGTWYFKESEHGCAHDAALTSPVFTWKRFCKKTLARDKGIAHWKILDGVLFAER